jgi:putative membrane protein
LRISSLSERGDALTISLVVTWVATVLTYHRGWSSGPTQARHRLVSFSLGTALVLAAISPPLEHLSEDLVSVHMVQHVLLILIGAPLIALGRPLETLLVGLPMRARKTVGRLRRQARVTPATTPKVTRPLVVWMLYALALWVWHGSVPHETATENAWLHILEHAVFLSAALAFWSMVLVPRRSRPGMGFRLLALFATAFHGVLLGRS